MIIRLGLNVAAHLAAGVALGACAVLATAYVARKQRRRGGDAPAPVAGPDAATVMAPGAPGD